MRRGPLTLIALGALGCLMVTNPAAVIGSFALAAFVLVLWRLVAPHGGVIRRGGRR